MFEPVDAALDDVAACVLDPVERRWTPTTGAFRRPAGLLIRPFRTGEPDPAPPQQDTGTRMRIRLVRHHRIRTGSRPSTPKAGDLDPVEQRRERLEPRGVQRALEGVRQNRQPALCVDGGDGLGKAAVLDRRRQKQPQQMPVLGGKL